MVLIHTSHKVQHHAFRLPTLVAFQVRKRLYGSSVLKTCKHRLSSFTIFVMKSFNHAPILPLPVGMEALPPCRRTRSQSPFFVFCKSGCLVAAMVSAPPAVACLKKYVFNHGPSFALVATCSLFGSSASQVSPMISMSLQLILLTADSVETCRLSKIDRTYFVLVFHTTFVITKRFVIQSGVSSKRPIAFPLKPSLL